MAAPASPLAGLPWTSDVQFQILEGSAVDLEGYAEVFSAFRVTRVLTVGAESGGFSLSERPVEASYVKDYDALEHPSSWARRFDLSNWGFLSAWSGPRRIGGAAVALRTPELTVLEGADLAVLWDIRVAADFRRLGVGAALFRRATSWAAERGSSRFKVETQDVNVAACRLYLAQGCQLGAVNRFAYPDLPEEIQLLWYKDIDVGSV